MPLALQFSAPDCKNAGFVLLTIIHCAEANLSSLFLNAFLLLAAGVMVVFGAAGGIGAALTDLLASTHPNARLILAVKKTCVNLHVEACCLAH
jgi:hypothetical protein